MVAMGARPKIRRRAQHGGVAWLGQRAHWLWQHFDIELDCLENWNDLPIDAWYNLEYVKCKTRISCVPNIFIWVSAREHRYKCLWVFPPSLSLSHGSSGPKNPRLAKDALGSAGLGSATDFCEDFWFPARSASVCSVCVEVLPDKNDDAWTTSSKFKLDLVAPLLSIPCNNGVGQWAWKDAGGYFRGSHLCSSDWKAEFSLNDWYLIPRLLLAFGQAGSGQRTQYERITS